MSGRPVPRPRLRALALAGVSCLLLSSGCLTLRHEVRAFQDGKELGRWSVTTDPSTNYTPFMDGGRRLVIIPAHGVFTGTLWYRSGGVVIETEQVKP